MHVTKCDAEMMGFELILLHKRFGGYSIHIKDRIHFRNYPEARYILKVGMKSRVVFVAFRKLVWECLKNRIEAQKLMMIRYHEKGRGCCVSEVTDRSGRIKQVSVLKCHE